MIASLRSIIKHTVPPDFPQDNVEDKLDDTFDQCAPQLAWALVAASPALWLPVPPPAWVVLAVLAA